MSYNCQAQCTTPYQQRSFVKLDVNTGNQNPALDCSATLTIPRWTKKIFFVLESGGCFDHCFLDGATAIWQIDITIGGNILSSTYGTFSSISRHAYIADTYPDISSYTKDNDVPLVIHISITPAFSSFPDGWYIHLSANLADCRIVGNIGKKTWSNSRALREQVDAASDTTGTDIPVNAHVPLGATLNLEMRSDELQNRVQLASAAVNDQHIGTNSLDPRALFPTSVLVPIGDPAAASTAYSFQATHTGTATITLTPVTRSSWDACTSVVPIYVTVEQPQALGPSTSVDEEIKIYADRSGIPPQFLKAQMDRESSGKLFL